MGLFDKWIIKKRAETVEKIKGVLDGIPFNSTTIPKEDIYWKEGCGKKKAACLYDSAQKFIQELNTPTSFTDNIQELDDNLLKLAEAFRTSVAQGDRDQAFSCRNSMYNIIVKMRNRLEYFTAGDRKTYIPLVVEYSETALNASAQYGILKGKTDNLNNLIKMKDKDLQEEKKKMKDQYDRIALMENGFILVGVTPNAIQGIKGLIFIITVIFSFERKKGQVIN